MANRNKQVEAHCGLTDSVKKIDEGTIPRWEKLCLLWEAESFPRTAKNPYHAEGSGRYYYLPTLMLDTTDARCIGITEVEVKKQLADEEKKCIDGGGISLHSTSAWAFIALRLELEESQ